MNKKYHYTYTIINPESGQYYHGKHSTDDLDDGYIGSGAWINENREDPRLVKIINEFYSSSAEAYNAERQLVQDLWKKDPLCMNRMKGGKTSFFEHETYSEHCKKVWGYDHHMKSPEFCESFVFPFKDPAIQEKVDSTLRRIYGSRGSGSTAIREKVEHTNLKRYGKTHTLHTESVTKARESACLEKFGVANPWHNQEKVRELMVERYGVSNMMHDPAIRQKHKDIMANKVDWKARDEKTKAIFLEKYGTTNPMNRPGIREKHMQECPYGCVTKAGNNLFDSGNFTNHMIKKHNWSKDDVAKYKQNQKNSTAGSKTRDED